MSVSTEKAREYSKRYWEKKAAATGCEPEDIPAIAAQLHREYHTEWNKHHRDSISKSNHKYYISHKQD